MLQDKIKNVPKIFDHETSTRLIDEINDELNNLTPTAKELIVAIASSSPYLARLISRNRQELERIFQSSVGDVISQANENAIASGDISDPAEQKIMLRRVKEIVALTLAFAEVGGVISTMDAAKAFSTFADAAQTGAMRASLRKAEAKGFCPVDVSKPENDCGICIIAMGKLGAQELNYSSDIDIIVLYDPNSNALAAGDAREIAIAVTKNIVALLQEQTKEGFVFRTDLRLRPDPGVTAAAVSITAAETYYEVHGQNWERAAFIKARACAGDKKVGEGFLEKLRPFIWRKYLDFAAIEDIHSIKRQIHAAKGGVNIEFEGHDLKIGKGGIREIEFLAQTQQLILGGKNMKLRSRETLEALQSLQDLGALSKSAFDDLTEAYEYLRCVEHRIQMTNDQQTHKIPKSSENIDRLVAFLGEESVADFRRKLTTMMEQTHAHFADLFEQEDRLSVDAGSLSFTGVENNPETLKSLSRMGFNRPEAISETVRHWHTGGIRATRTARARELLTKLTPHLLEGVASASDPDEAFLVFDRFLMSLPSGVQIFSLLANAPWISERLFQIITIAPALARSIAKKRHLIESLLENDWPQHIPSPEQWAEDLVSRLSGATRFEEKLNVARKWQSEEHFQISAQLVCDHISIDEAAKYFSHLAEQTISAMLPVTIKEVESQYGKINGSLAIIAMGRLGTQKMTATSDVDIIFIYDVAEGAVSSGEKSLDGVTYFTRLVRRLVTSLSAATEQGILYEVDMQLRPSGGAGPAAVSKTAFVKYFANDAWTWERMALTKARTIGGKTELSNFLNEEIDRIIQNSGSPAKIAEDVREMRLMLLENKKTTDLWNLKHVFGGVTEIEFLMQARQLQLGRRIKWRDSHQIRELDIDDTTADALLRADRLFETTIQLSRATTEGVFNPSGSGLALKNRMSQAFGVESLSIAEEIIAQTQIDVRNIYSTLIEQAVNKKG